MFYYSHKGKTKSVATLKLELQPIKLRIIKPFPNLLPIRKLRFGIKLPASVYPPSKGTYSCRQKGN